MNRKNDMHETPEYLDGHVTTGVANKKMETDKIRTAAENILPAEPAEVEHAESEANAKAQTFGSRIGRHRPSLSTILATLTAFSLLSLVFCAVSVASFFSGGGKSARRRRRR